MKNGDLFIQYSQWEKRERDIYFLFLYYFYLGIYIFVGKIWYLFKYYYIIDWDRMYINMIDNVGILYIFVLCLLFIVVLV